MITRKMYAERHRVRCSGTAMLVRSGATETVGVALAVVVVVPGGLRRGGYEGIGLENLQGKPPHRDAQIPKISIGLQSAPTPKTIGTPTTPNYPLLPVKMSSLFRI